MRSTAIHYIIAYSTYVHIIVIIQSKFTVQSSLYYYTMMRIPMISAADEATPIMTSIATGITKI